MFAKRSRSGACSAWEAQLEDYLEVRLDAVHAEAVQAHIRSCGACAAALERAGASVALFKSAGPWPLPAPDPYFSTRVISAIRRERSESDAWKPLEIAGWELCWLAAAAALILAVFTLRYQLATPPPSLNAPAQQSQVQELINLPMYQPAVQDDTLLVASTSENGR